MKGIKCIAPVFDMSGYAEWARKYILALHEYGVPITIGTDLVRNTGNPITFEQNRPDLGKEGEILKSLVNKKIEYDVAIAWLTPEMALEQLSIEKPEIKKINFTLWETSKIHDTWCKCFSNFNEVWVPGRFNLGVFSNSINRFIDKNTNPELNNNLKNLKIKSFLTPIKENGTNEEDFTFFCLQDLITGKIFDDSYYAFYFISQWSERKNFIDLIEAYWAEFKNNEKVVLVLKTYFNSPSPRENEYFKKMFEQLKQSTNLTNLPEICLLNRVMSSTEINKLHKRCNCYVNPSRGEGLGLGIIEAGLQDKLVISNLYGEQATYLNESSGLIYDHYMRPVRNMGSPWYQSDQNWAAPNMQTLRVKMREAFSNRNSDVHTQKGSLLKDQIIKISNPQKIAKEILDYLND